ncbi:hypothetical protein SDC9_151156 [bioreactor metagenome]|uniref:Uncharacterized protein n=1 Tax=bioreactor metagenome TaxID=1076179 RepID=A0A645EPH6_9ZZZZ
MRADHTRAVRPDEADAVAFRSCYYFLFAFGVSRLREAGADYYGGLYAAFAAVLQDPVDRDGWGRDNGHVDLFGDVVQRGATLRRAYRNSLWVYGKDPFHAAIEQAVD